MADGSIISPAPDPRSDFMHPVPRLAYPRCLGNPQVDPQSQGQKKKMPPPKKKRQAPLKDVLSPIAVASYFIEFTFHPRLTMPNPKWCTPSVGRIQRFVHWPCIRCRTRPKKKEAGPLIFTIGILPPQSPLLLHPASAGNIRHRWCMQMSHLRWKFHTAIFIGWRCFIMAFCPRLAGSTTLIAILAHATEAFCLPLT